MDLYSRSEAAAMLGITVRKLDELRARRLIGYYQRCPGGKVQFSMAHLEKYSNKFFIRATSKYKRELPCYLLRLKKGN